MTRTLVPRLVLPVLLAAGPAAAQDPGISSSIEKVFVVEMSHTDVGFTDPPTVVAQVAHDNLVEALRLADLDADFRWTVETGFQLEQFDRLATPADRARMRQRFAEGRFVLGAGYVGPHSGIWTEELLLRFTHPSARLAAEYGARMDAALLDDVPGYTLGMPTALARAGVDYLLCGPNDFIGGKPAIPLAERPFW
jgi:alpha-mannosidase